MPSKQDLLRLIENDEPSHIKFLQELIQAPSPNPHGDTRKAIAVVERYLSSLKIQTEIIAPKQESPNLVSTIRTSGQSQPKNEDRSIVLNGHIDQFPVSDADQWQKEPYSGDIEDGYVHG